MNTLQIRKESNALAWFFALTYMVSYITRINFGAVIAEMVTETGMARADLALSLTGSFITYGLGQIVSGMCGDRFSPKKLVAYGLGATTVMNALIPLCTSPYHMLIVWSLNGFAQAFLWPPMVRLMTAQMSPEEYSHLVVRVSWGSSFGTILIYLLSPVFITLSGWRCVFLFSAVCGAGMLLIWLRCCRDSSPEFKASKTRTTSHGGMVLLSPTMLCVMVTIILQGMLRDGVTTWMPSYIAQTYSLNNQTAILTGVILPLFAIISLQATSWLYRKRFTNPLLCMAVIFAVGAISSVALRLFSGSAATLSVLFSALLTGAMHGANLIQTGIIPAFFREYGNVATVSGILNSCTYIGSAISTYGIAVLSETIGWSDTLVLWALIAAVGMILCLACTRAWKCRFS
ncbi:MAG: MFS transporter [Oscillospiraceae bacterium]|nr:MFS transporter [Oscillospiraceae bacterium]